MTSQIRSAISSIFAPSNHHIEAKLFYSSLVGESNIKRPVVFIPGYTSSGLELWSFNDCANARFRDRIWGTVSMVKLFFRDPQCWIKHMMLEPEYNSEDAGGSVHFNDPPGIRIRPSAGLAAADFVIGEYWVWGPIIEALGRSGYDESMLSMEAYDWRLPLRDLERRDNYCVVDMVALHGERVLMVTHSFGAKVWFFFIHWATEHLGSTWIDQYIHATYHVAGLFLGVPKALAALLSGDTRDTAELGAMSTLLDAVLPPVDRSRLTSAWGSIVDMLPEGGDQLWPNTTLILKGQDSRNLTLNESLELLFNTSGMYAHAYHRNHSTPGRLRCPHNHKSVKECYMDSWTSMLQSPLPKSPKLRIWCAYGVGLPTEVGFSYVVVDSNYTSNTAYKIDQNVLLEDGDGSVPLVSLGLTCARGWKAGSPLNPAGIDVKVREIPHGESYSPLARAVGTAAAGGTSGDHVDILGNAVVIRDVLQLALGLDSHMEPETAVPIANSLNITDSFIYNSIAT